MTVFKNYFKIVKQFLSVIILYIVIFTTFSAVATSSNNIQDSFTTIKLNVAIINNDNSKLTATFIKYIEEKSNIINLEDDEDVLRDALFYREVDYIMIVPSGFGNDFVLGEEVKIETMKVPDSTNTFYAEMIFNKFWNIASVYKNIGMSDEDIANIILDDLNDQAEVTLLNSKQNEMQNVMYFYNFANYTILATIIFIVGMIVNIFNNENIKKRNIIGTISYKSINKQLFLGNAIITLLLWILYIIISVVLYGNLMFTGSGLLIIINALIFSICALSLALLVGNLIKNKEAQNGVVNVIALGTSFICGAFVPQEMLGSFVLGIAKVFPSYWFIKNNSVIINLSQFNYASLNPVVINMMIVLIFALAFFIATNILSKSRLKGK